MLTENQRVVLGIHVDTVDNRIDSTLLSLSESVGLRFDVVLLNDCADQPDRWSALHDIPSLNVGTGAGRVASFNRLISGIEADIYGFIENGVQFAPDCLARLVAALNADPSIGLAGPSSNRCWNEQGVAAHWGQYPFTPARLAAAASALVPRFGTRFRTLEPLYALADFCYLAKRETIERIGAADAEYGAGPCWEMDYNIRAARAGFKGVWVGSALVIRPPCTEARHAIERDMMAANKQRYQDKFCGLRRHGAPYFEHCKGDACTHFARDIPVWIPLLPAPRFPAATQLPQPLASPRWPLVSCIMPTCGRTEFVAQSIRYFQRQDYPNTELIIAHETADDLPPFDDARIKTVLTPRKSSIGAKRNEALRHASGSIIAQWDDDDWYAPSRLSLQVEPLLKNLGDISGLQNTLFFHLPTQACWSVSEALFSRMFVQAVLGGTLVYWKRLLEPGIRYPASSLREDADFMLAVMRKGARLCRVQGRDIFLYIRHGGNTWKFAEGSFLEASDWHNSDLPAGAHEDLPFYARYASAPLPPKAPLVTCIMPTADREQFVPQAIEHFMRQSYPDKELLIIDDGTHPVADLIPALPCIRYVRLRQRASIGAKRNLACEMAKGSIILHWDDDDWMAPGWLQSQVTTLLSNDADVCGLSRVLFHAPEQGKAWQYVYDGPQPWVCGATLCYTRRFWESSKFPDINIGEDNAFVWSRQHKRLVVNSDTHLFVARIHQGNTSPKLTHDRRWRYYPPENVEQLFISGNIHS